jgi:hypothetical protein
MINEGTSRFIVNNNFYSDDEESPVAKENHINEGESVIVKYNGPFISDDESEDAVPVKIDVKV